MNNTRFLIASGGTGGHFYPGFALGVGRAFPYFSPTLKLRVISDNSP